MTILDPIISDFLAIPYPDEETDPFYDQFKGMVLDMEQIMLYSKMFVNMFCGGGGTRTWNPGSGLLTWTADFTAIVPHWGKKVTIPFGPDGLSRAAGLQDGQCLVIDLPMAMSDNITQNFQIMSQINVTEHNHFVFGARVGSALYLRNIGEFA